MTTIDSFRGDFRFLSNFWMKDVMFEGMCYPSTEHAFQAAKTRDHAKRVEIRNAKTCRDAKRMGRTVLLRDEWELVKDRVMLEVLREKFKDGFEKDALLATEQAELVEGNTWGDTYWGVCKGTGKNMLGKLLMQVREELQINKAVL